MAMSSVSLGWLGKDLSALKSIELLLVEESHPVVVDLLGITKEGSTYVVTNTVADKSSTSNKGPFKGSQLSVSKISQESGSDSEKDSKACTDNANLSGDTDGTTFSSKELILSKKVSLGLNNDLISSLAGLNV